jgi:ADP-heptose:LPS heptosyltransferase
MKDPRRILIYRCGAIGDTIVAIPAIRAIRTRYPEAQFVLMTAGGGEGIVWTDRVFSEFGWFDDVITYEARDLKSPSALWGIVRHVRAMEVDAVFYLGSDKNSALKILRDQLFFRLAGVRRFVGTYSDKVTFWGRLRRKPQRYPNEVDRLLAELSRRGIQSGEVSFDLPIAHAHAQGVSEILAGSGLNLSKRLVAMCPGSKQKIKIWPEERFAEIGRRLIAEADADVVIVGGSDEVPVGERLIAGWPAGRASNLAQRLSILESAELLRRCVFYVGNDTGAMHLAATVGTRCVAIFAARDQARSWHPYGDNHAILRKSVPCQNCYLSDCVEQELRCLKDISSEEVWAACQRMMVYR